jgi:hypothetical protein
LARESMRGKELRRDCENKSTYNVGEVSSESGICTSLVVYVKYTSMDYYNIAEKQV